MAAKKILFSVTQDDAGYPGVDIEGIWASPTDIDHVYVIDNIPFYARQATVGDKVLAKDCNGELIFEAVVEQSRSSLIRVIVYDIGTLSEIRSVLMALGCAVETSLKPAILAVDVPGRVCLESVQKYLSALEEQEVASYEEPILRHGTGHKPS